MPDTLTRAPDHDAWMDLAAEEYRWLVLLLRGLDPDDWSAPTDCPGWDVRAMVAHLCGAADGTARPLEYVRQSVVGLVRHRRRMLVDSINEVQISDRSERDVGSLVDELADAAPRSVRTRSRFPAPVRACVVPFGPPLGTRSVGYLTDRIFTRDAWMHRIDICRATGRGVDLSPDHDGVLLDDLVTEWARAHGRAYDLELTGRVALHRVGGGTGERISVDAVEFARTLAGRLPGTGLLATTVPF